MFPVIARFNSFTIYTYGLFLAAAFFVGIFWAARRARRAGLSPFAFFELGVYGGMVCLIGSRLLYVAVNWTYFSREPWQMIRLWDGGLILYGGYISYFVFAALYIRAAGMPLWKSLDVGAPALPLGIAIGRLGCFFNGCCYGIRSDSWGISFSSAYHPPVYLQQVQDGLIKPDSLETLPVLPTQLYSAAADLGIVFLLLYLERKRRFPGYLFWMFIVFYSVVRGIVEFFRQHDPEEMISVFAPLSLSQGISLVCLIGAAGTLLVLWKLHRGVNINGYAAKDQAVRRCADGESHP